MNLPEKSFQNPCYIRYVKNKGDFKSPLYLNFYFYIFNLFRIGCKYGFITVIFGYIHDLYDVLDGHRLFCFDRYAGIFCVF